MIFRGFFLQLLVSEVAGKHNNEEIRSYLAATPEKKSSQKMNPRKLHLATFDDAFLAYC